jgi:hypothetical protein
MPRRFLVVWTGFALLWSVHVTGCTVIGYGLGSAIDASRPIRMRDGSRGQLLALEPGARLRLRLADSTVVTGVYRGLTAELDSSYARRYEAWRESGTAPFRAPRLGERIGIDSQTHALTARPFKGAFLGFGPGRVHVLPAGSRRPTFQAFSRLRQLEDSTGAKVSGKALAQALDRLPIQAIAIIWDGKTERRVDLLDDRIAEVGVGLPHRGFRNAGLLVGVAGDATVIVLLGAASTASSSSPTCEPGSTSYARSLPARALEQPDVVLVPRGAMALGR